MASVYRPYRSTTVVAFGSYISIPYYINLSNVLKYFVSPWKPYLLTLANLLPKRLVFTKHILYTPSVHFITSKSSLASEEPLVKKSTSAERITPNDPPYRNKTLLKHLPILPT
jgi:hypothetical protein